MFYNTLDQALTYVATRSFDEDVTVTPEDGGYTVEEDFSTAFVVTQVLYDETKEGRIDWTGWDVGMPKPDDWSGLRDSAEYFDNSQSIRYYLETAVEALEAGNAVTFAYLIAEDPCTEDNPCFTGDYAYCVEHGCDAEAAGWLLAAVIHD